MIPAVVFLGMRVLLALVLYAFLAAVLVMLWRDLRSASRQGARVPLAHLLVCDGPDAGGGHVLGEVNLLGRARDNTVWVSDSTVSAYHARLSFQAGQWWLEDLGSRNGTRVNDIPLEVPTVVTYGDEIGLGRVRLLLQLGALENC